MRSLSEQERATLSARREALAGVIDGCEPALVELADHLGHPHPERAPRALDEVVTRLDEVWPRLDLARLDEAQLVWLQTRLFYLTAAWLVSRHGGRWLLQDDPSSDFFGRYVIGGFEACDDPHLIIDPLEVALHAMTGPRRPLHALLMGLLDP